MKLHSTRDIIAGEYGERLLRWTCAGAGPPTEPPAMVTAEQVCISSLTMLKTSKHGQPRVPMEVKGLTFLEFVDDDTIGMTVPQAGTVSEEKLLVPCSKPQCQVC